VLWHEEKWGTLFHSSFNARTQAYNINIIIISSKEHILHIVNCLAVFLLSRLHSPRHSKAALHPLAICARSPYVSCFAPPKSMLNVPVLALCMPNLAAEASALPTFNEDITQPKRALAEFASKLRVLPVMHP
jgi:hypothetical protein